MPAEAPGRERNETDPGAHAQTSHDVGQPVHHQVGAAPRHADGQDKPQRDPGPAATRRGEQRDQQGCRDRREGGVPGRVRGARCVQEGAGRPRAVDEGFDDVVRHPRGDLTGEQDPHRRRSPGVMEDERRRADDAPTEGEPSQGVEDPFREEREERCASIRDDARPPVIGGGWARVDRHGDAEGDGDQEERRAERHRPTGMDEDVRSLIAAGPDGTLGSASSDARPPPSSPASRFNRPGGMWGDRHLRPTVLADRRDGPMA